jgi:hypothetical protein
LLSMDLSASRQCLLVKALLSKLFGAKWSIHCSTSTKHTYLN